MLRANLPAFAALDALVVPETTSLLLKTRFGLDRLKLILIPHGAGDRSIGFGDEIRGFDLVLLAGEKGRDRMLEAGLVGPRNHAVVGYPKFDTIATERPSPRLFANDRPTVLYNPHFDPRLSSWYDWGPAIVDWFAGQDRYNLILAPHVMLFRRRWHASLEHRRIRRPGRIRSRWRHAPDVLVDPGSVRSIDMTYVRSADLYLGDASSQIYEWIMRPRPAVFLNPGRIAWHGDPNFTHWSLGTVVDRLEALPEALDAQFAQPRRFLDAQRDAFTRTFSITGTPAAVRASDAILAHLG